MPRIASEDEEGKKEEIEAWPNKIRIHLKSQFQKAISKNI
jgi:hypothetical protein